MRAWFVLALAACSGASTSSAPVDRPTFSGEIDSDAFALVDGVVVQPRLETLYFADPRGRIVAIELATGGSRWGATEADIPLAIHNGTLLARDLSGGLVAFDTDTGEPVPLPDDANAPPASPPATAPSSDSFELASADRAHLMRVERLPDGQWAWTISALDTGAQVAQLTLTEPARAFYVHGPLVIAPTATHVRALALDGGDEIWRWQLRAPR